MRVAKCSTSIRPVRLWEVRLNWGDMSKNLDTFNVHVILFIVSHHNFLSALRKFMRNAFPMFHLA
jgi:hypothetical protein